MAQHALARTGESKIRAIANPDLVSWKDANGWTHLHLAALLGDIQKAQLLLSSGADVNARDNYRLTPLHRAVARGDRNMVLLLLAYGADVNAEGEIYGTPLEYAKEKSNCEVVELLAKRASGVNTTIRIMGDQLVEVSFPPGSLPPGSHLHVKCGSVDVDLDLGGGKPAWEPEVNLVRKIGWASMAVTGLDIVAHKAGDFAKTVGRFLGH